MCADGCPSPSESPKVCVSENCGNVVALLDARLKRERDSHADNEKEAGETMPTYAIALILPGA